MFIKDVRRFYVGSEQRTTGLFLMVFCRSSGGELRGCVRKIKLSQFGHFMMGSVKLAGVEFTLSGGFGSDGLPMGLDGHKANGMSPPEIDHFWGQLFPIPQQLADRYWKADDGHNSVPGSVSGDFRIWALANLDDLQRRISAMLEKAD